MRDGLLQVWKVVERFVDTPYHCLDNFPENVNGLPKVTCRPQPEDKPADKPAAH